MTNKLVYPTVNMNGTDGKELFNQYRAVYEAFEPLMDALAGARPHGRDYQTMPVGSYETAREQYHAAEAKVLEAKQFIEALALNIMNQTK
jgi:hypothetical protein